MAKPEFIARQAARPRGLLGWIVAQIMSRETGWENAVAIDLLELQPGQSVIDVGCGHGASLPVLARRVQFGRVSGLDPSAVMVGVAQKKAALTIVDIVCGEANDMPFDDNTFDAAMSVHTIYFWDNPIAELKEIRRIVGPNGRFVLCFRSSEDSRFIADSPASVYHIRSLHEVTALVGAAGWRIEAGEKARARGALFHWLTCRPA